MGMDQRMVISKTLITVLSIEGNPIKSLSSFRFYETYQIRVINDLSFEKPGIYCDCDLLDFPGEHNSYCLNMKVIK